MSTPTSKKMVLGAHMLIGKGLSQAIIDGSSIGCNTIQIFSKSARQWNAKPLDPKEVDLFKKTRAKCNMGPIVVHASYLINIASPNEATHNRSVAALKEELERCEELGVDYLVFHPGSTLKTSTEEALTRIASGLDRIFDKCKTKTKILIESTAGQGSHIGFDLEHLATILKLAQHQDKLGICLDTCHTDAAGYDFSTSNSYSEFWKEFDRIIGINKLKAIHLNDSATPRNSRKDRHANIGEGTMGLEAFKLIMNDPRLIDIPKILETPKETLEEDRVNLERLIGLVDKKNISSVENSSLKMYLKK